MRSLLPCFQYQHDFGALSFLAVKLNAAVRIAVEHGTHVHIVEAEMIIIPVPHDLPASLGRDSLPVICDAEYQITFRPPPDNRNAAAALKPLKSMLNRIFHKRLQNELRHITFIDPGIHAHRDVQTSLTKRRC